VQKLDTHRESTRETSSKVKSASARERESESVERTERASELKKGAHRHTQKDMEKDRDRGTDLRTEFSCVNARKYFIASYSQNE